MFDTSEKLIVEKADEIFGVSQTSWETSSWKQLSLVNDGEVISLSHAKVYVLSNSVLCLGKVNQNPTSNTVWERQLDWFKDSFQYRTLDTIDGEPMEFEWNIFPRFTTSQLVDEVQKFINKMGDPAQFQGRIIFMSMFNDITWRTKDIEQEWIANAHLCLKKISSRTLVIPRTCVRKEVVFFLQRKTTRRMGQSRWIDDDHIQRKRTPSFPSHKSIVPKNAQKTKEVENYRYTSVPMGKRLKLFFAQLFLLISSVSTKQSQMCVMNTRPVKQERGDPWWQNNLTHCSSQQVCWWQHLHLRPKFLHKKIYCKSTKNEWKIFHNKTECSKFVLMHDSWQ